MVIDKVILFTKLIKNGVDRQKAAVILDGRYDEEHSRVLYEAIIKNYNTEVIENPFLSSARASELLKAIEKGVDPTKLAGYSAPQIAVLREALALGFTHPALFNNQLDSVQMEKGLYGLKKGLNIEEYLSPDRSPELMEIYIALMERKYKTDVLKQVENIISLHDSLVSVVTNVVKDNSLNEDDINIILSTLLADLGSNNTQFKILNNFTLFKEAKIRNTANKMILIRAAIRSRILSKEEILNKNLLWFTDRDLEKLIIDKAKKKEATFRNVARDLLAFSYQFKIFDQEEMEKVANNIEAIIVSNRYKEKEESPISLLDDIIESFQKVGVDASFLRNVDLDLSYHRLQILYKLANDLQLGLIDIDAKTIERKLRDFTRIDVTEEDILEMLKPLYIPHRFYKEIKVRR